jgi:hypothetical protein
MFKEGLQLSNRHGEFIDERVVEYPWFISRLNEEKTRLLDAGSILNYSYILQHPKIKNKDITIITLEPEFSVNTSTQELTLNIGEYITSSTQVTVVQKKGYIWTGTESLITSGVSQAQFLRLKEAELPNMYYYGGNPG